MVARMLAVMMQGPAVNHRDIYVQHSGRRRQAHERGSFSVLSHKRESCSRAPIASALRDRCPSSLKIFLAAFRKSQTKNNLTEWPFAPIRDCRTIVSLTAMLNEIRNDA